MSELAYDQSMTAKSLKEGQIPRELDRQSRALEELHMALSELEERTVVIRVPQPVPGVDPRPEAIRAGFAQALADRADAIEGATRRVRTMTAELEL